MGEFVRKSHALLTCEVVSTFTMSKTGVRIVRKPEQAGYLNRGQRAAPPTVQPKLRGTLALLSRMLANPLAVPQEDLVVAGGDPPDRQIVPDPVVCRILG